MEWLLTLTKTFALVLFFSFYCGVIYWTMRKKNRKSLEELRNIPFRED